MRRAGAALALLALLALPRGAQAQDSVRVRGGLTGVVVDTAGRPVADVDVVVRETAIRARTRADGRFSLTGLPPDDYVLVFRKLGFEPVEFPLALPDGRVTEVKVTLGPLAQRLDAVDVRATVFNELGGLVLDAEGHPLADAEVRVEGASRVMRTRADGGFLFLDVAPGRYLLRVRKLGYRPHVRGLEMTKQLERNVTVQLEPLAQRLAAVEVRERSGYGARDSVTRQEFESRRRMAGVNSDLLTSEDLARAGRAPMNWAIRERALGMVKNVGWGNACVLIDGHQRLEDPARPLRGTPALPRDPAGIPFSPLQTVFADQVDAVEIYADGAENSRSACARFPIESPCGCAGVRPPPVIVIWLKR